MNSANKPFLFYFYELTNPLLELHQKGFQELIFVHLTAA